MSKKNNNERSSGKEVEPVEIVYRKENVVKSVRFARGPIEGKNFFYRKRRCVYCERQFDGMNVIEILKSSVSELYDICLDCYDMKNKTKLSDFFIEF